MTSKNDITTFSRNVGHQSIEAASLDDILITKDDTTTFSRNVGHHSYNDVAVHTKTTAASGEV